MSSIIPPQIGQILSDIQSRKITKAEALSRVKTIHINTEEAFLLGEYLEQIAQQQSPPSSAYLLAELTLIIVDNVADNDIKGMLLCLCANIFRRRPETICLTIEVYKKVLVIFRLLNDKRSIGTTMNNLAAAYFDLPTGNRDHNLTEAIRYYKEALTIRTKQAFSMDYAMTMNNLADTYYSLHTGDRDHNIIEAICCYKEALSIYTKQVFPRKYAKTMHCLGNTYYSLHTGDHDQNLAKAIRCYKEALSIRTKTAFPNVDIICDLGKAYEKKGEFDKAINEYFKVHSIIPEDKKVVLYLNNILRRKNYFKDVVRLYESYLRVVPNDSEILSDLGGILTDIGCPDKAIEKLHLSIQLNSRDKITYNNLAYAYFKLNKLDNALRYYRKALEIDPKYVRAWNDICTILWTQKKYDLLASEAEKGLQYFPNNPNFIQSLFLAHFLMEKYEDSINVAQKLLKLGNCSPANYYFLGFALYRLGRWPEAVNVFRKCIDLDPKMIRARFQLAETLWDMEWKKKDKAIAEYREILRILLQNNSFKEKVSILGETKNEVFGIDDPLTKNTIIIKKKQANGPENKSLEFEFKAAKLFEEHLSSAQFTPPPAYQSSKDGKTHWRKYEMFNNLKVTKPITTINYDDFKFYIYKRIKGDTLSELLSQSARDTSSSKTGNTKFQLLQQTVTSLAIFHLRLSHLLDKPELINFELPLLDYEQIIKNRFIERFNLDYHHFIKELDSLKFFMVKPLLVA